MLSGNSTIMDKCTNLGSDLAADQPFPYPVWIGHPAKFGTFHLHRDQTYPHIKQGPMLGNTSLAHIMVHPSLLFHSITNCSVHVALRKEVELWLCTAIHVSQSHWPWVSNTFGLCLHLWNLYWHKLPLLSSRIFVLSLFEDAHYHNSPTLCCLLPGLTGHLASHRVV